MNAKQQEIITLLINEFNRIESSSVSNKGFNLIDVGSLQEKSKEIAKYKAEEELDVQAWRKVADEEAFRLVALFQQDLPMVEVYKYGKANGHRDIPTVGIVGIKEIIRIDVCIKREDYKDRYGNFYSKGIQLYYECNFTGNNRFNTIEELVASPMFLEGIRTNLKFN